MGLVALVYLFPNVETIGGFWLVFGREWYVEHGRQAPARLDDVLVSLRGTADRAAR